MNSKYEGMDRRQLAAAKRELAAKLLKKDKEMSYEAVRAAVEEECGSPVSTNDIAKIKQALADGIDPETGGEAGESEETNGATAPAEMSADEVPESVIKAATELLALKKKHKINHIIVSEEMLEGLINAYKALKGAGLSILVIAENDATKAVKITEQHFDITLPQAES